MSDSTKRDPAKNNLVAANRIDRMFASRSRDEKLMSLFLTAGYPTPEDTVRLATGLADTGTDLLEIGMPFSDPLADGPTIQYSSNVALENGMDLDGVFDTVRRIRHHSDIPLVLMGYLNPILHYGMEAFMDQAADAGVDGLILPDVPPEESGELQQWCRHYGIHQIFLIAPNSSDERMREIDAQSKGFVYCVSVTGVTGSRQGDEIQRSVDRFIDRVVQHATRNPVLVGFGIQTHDDARRISERTDGFVVGSALINAIRRHYPDSQWLDKVLNEMKILKYGKQASSADDA